MKLVELLAREISEWPEEAKHAIQDDDGCFKFGAGSNPKDYGDGIWVRDIEIEHELYNGFNPSEKTSDRKTAIVTRAQWQAERDRQKGGEWKRHRGGAQPVDNDVYVEVHLRCGDIQQSHAQDFIWPHKECDRDANLTKYRVIIQPQAEEVDVKDTTIGTLSYKVEIDTTEATQAIDALAAKWDQVDGPLRWRDCVNELDAYIEEFTREREALINRLALEGFALIPAMTPVIGVADVDMSDWRNWKAGDIVECVNQNGWKDISEGSQYVLNKHDFFSFVDDVGENRSFAFGEMDEGSVGFDFKFIRRP